MPSEPAMAVSTAMRILRIFPQLISFDMVLWLRVMGERLVVSGEWANFVHRSSLIFNR